mgnify:FL=1
MGVCGVVFLGENMMDTLIANWDQYMELLLAAVGFFSVLASLTKNESDDQKVQIALDLINRFGMNVGKAKNAE